MIAKRGRGRERKPDYVTTWGEKIEGAYLGTDGRLRPIGKPFPAFGGDEKLAVHKFKQWQASQNKGTPYTPAASQSIMGMMAVDEERERIRHLILTNPKQAAIELDIPHLAWYPKRPDKPQFTLAELADEYVTHKRNKRTGKKLDRKYCKNLKAWWGEFLKIIGTPVYARDIERSMIQRYKNEVMDKGNSPAYVESRYAAVKAILQYAIDSTDDTADCRQALDCCGILKPPQEEDAAPDPISCEHFASLLSHLSPSVKADIRLRAMMLLSLNGAMKNGEVASVLKEDIDLEARTYCQKRPKTGVPRCAKLWPRTVDAIREYQQSHPHQSEYLFVSREGGPYTGEAIRQAFVTLRTRAKLPQVTFDMIRDGAYLEAFRISPVYARWIGGHTAWTRQPTESKDITNRYVFRDPNDPNVIACCEAIEQHYFPATASPQAET